MRSRLFASLAATLALLAGCSLGPRADWAEAIRDAQEAAVERGSAVGRMVVSMEIVETVGTTRPQALLSELEMAVDFTSGRSVQRALQPETRQGAEIRAADLVVYVPRSVVREGEESWAALDFSVQPEDDINVDDRRFSRGWSMITPALAVELLQGVLTGSIERVGPDEVAGTATTHYQARLSRDAAVLEIDDEVRRDGIRRIFQTMGVRDDVFEAEVWLDDDGLPRRITYLMRQHQDRVNIFDLTVTWEYFGYGGVEPIDVPTSALGVDGFRELAVEFLREDVVIPQAAAE